MRAPTSTNMLRRSPFMAALSLCFPVRYILEQFCDDVLAKAYQFIIHDILSMGFRTLPDVSEQNGQLLFEIDSFRKVLDVDIRRFSEICGKVLQVKNTVNNKYEKAIEDERSFETMFQSLLLATHISEKKHPLILYAVPERFCFKFCQPISLLH